MKFNLLKKLKPMSCFLCLILGIACGAFVVPAHRLVWRIIEGENLQTVTSVNGDRASLYKSYSFLDTNFKVRIGGETIYISPDLPSFPDRMCRETLIWDETGRVVVLELIGKRVFAYDIVEKRELKKGELAQYQLNSTNMEYAQRLLKDIDDDKEEQELKEVSNSADKNTDK